MAAVATPLAKKRPFLAVYIFCGQISWYVRAVEVEVRERGKGGILNFTARSSAVGAERTDREVGGTRALFG